MLLRWIGIPKLESKNDIFTPMKPNNPRYPRYYNGWVLLYFMQSPTGYPRNIMYQRDDLWTSIRYHVLPGLFTMLSNARYSTKYIYF